MDLFSQMAEATKPATAIMSAPIPTQPEERKPQQRIFTNIPDLLTEVRKMSYSEKMNFEQFKQLQKDIESQEASIVAMINKMTIAEINKFVYKHSNSDSKKEMVSRLYDSIAGSFTLNKSVSYSPFGGNGPTTYKEALKIAIDSVTEEELNIYQLGSQADRDQRKKAIENPETLEEFRTFLMYRKPEAMTTAQRVLYDELITEGKQERREINNKYAAEVKAVKVEGLQMEIKTSHHAKKNIPLWVVVLSERIAEDVFKELKDKVHKFDGYYSSYRGQGAIPGFTFESEENAQLFCGLQEGNVNTYDLQQKIAAERAQERAETLEEKAARVKEAGEESLNRDRKDNTHKRAKEAAHAEAEAMANIEFVGTMQKIAEGQKDGTIKFLTRLHNITDLDTLNGILSGAEYDYIKAKEIRYEDYELNLEVVDFIKFPYPSIYISNVLQDIAKLQNVSGCKLAAARMIKVLSRAKNDYVTIVDRQALEDFEKLLCTHHRQARTFYGNVEFHKADLMDYKRVMRMHLESLPELRTALRELVNIKLNTTISPEMKRAQEIKELDRKFIGVKIDGFFPTPRELAEHIVGEANIEPGHTILEPSAGLGHLADTISDLHPDNDLKVIEISYSLCEALKLKGYEIESREDFLQHSGKYDRIIMNPPFENGQDIDHVLHAYSLLNEGGRLVAIMAGNKQKSDGKTAGFMELVAHAGYYEENPAGSFLSSFRPTGVNTITVIMNKK